MHHIILWTVFPYFPYLCQLVVCESLDVHLLVSYVHQDGLECAY